MKSASAFPVRWSILPLLYLAGCAVPVGTDETQEFETLEDALVVKANDTYGFGSSAGPGNPAATLAEGCGSTFGCAYTRGRGFNLPQRIYQFCISRVANSNIQPALLSLATAAASATANKVQIGVSVETTAGDGCGAAGGPGYIFVNDVGDSAIPRPASGEARISRYSVVLFSGCIQQTETRPGRYFICNNSTLSINTGAILTRAPIEAGGRGGATNIRQAVIRGALVAMGFGERLGATSYTNPNFSFFTQSLSNPLVSSGNWLACQLNSLPAGFEDTTFAYSGNCPAGF
ncbi:MAG TPA: hypothetical protein VGK73_10595 [Polyangiaceae bacterium]